MRQQQPTLESCASQNFPLANVCQLKSIYVTIDFQQVHISYFSLDEPNSLITECDPASGEIVRRQLHPHRVSHQYTNEVFSYPSTDGTQDDLSSCAHLNTEHRARETLRHDAFHLENESCFYLFCHGCIEFGQRVFILNVLYFVYKQIPVPAGFEPLVYSIKNCQRRIGFALERGARACPKTTCNFRLIAHGQREHPGTCFKQPRKLLRLQDGLEKLYGTDIRYIF